MDDDSHALSSMAPSEWQDWLKTTLGQELLRQEYSLLSEFCKELFGYRLVQVGELGSDPSYLEYSPAGSKSIIGLDHPQQMQKVQALSSSLALPLMTDSLDAVILPHSLDFSLDPHQLLREVERVLVPEGHLVILGFNPISSWGMAHIVKRRSGKLPWSGQFLSYVRLQDWLSLLGFDMERTEVLMFRPPIQRESMLQRFQFLDAVGARYFPMFAGVYAIRAVKRVSTLRPVGLIRRISRLRPSRNRAMEPTTRREISK